MPDKRKPMEIQFPFKGIDQITSYRRQPPGTTPYALNVRPFDALEQRLRGGQRSGHSKYFSSAVNGTNMIQQIDSMSIVLDPWTIVADTVFADEDFLSYSDEDDIAPNSGGEWEEWVHTDPNWVKRVAGYHGTTDDDEYGVMCMRQDISEVFMILMRYATILALGTQYIIRVTLYPPRGSAVGNQKGIFGIQVRMDNPTMDAGGNTDKGTQVGFVCSSAAGTEEVGVLYEDDNAWINGGGNALGNLVVTFDELAVCDLRVNGNDFSFYWNNLLVGTWNTAANSTLKGIGIILRSGLSGSEWSPFIKQVEVITGKVPVSLRIPRIITVSGGSLYAGNLDNGLSLMTNGADIFQAVERVAIQEAYQKSYFCDSYSSGYRVLNHSTDTVSSWEATAGSLPVNSQGTTYAITGVNQGTKTFTVAEDLSSWVDGEYFIITGSTGNDGAYTVSAVAGAGPTNLTVDQTIPDANVDGYITRALVACRLMCLYRGRIVLSGMHTDPHNWFMSAVGNPLDWDYSPTTTSATMAVAGSSTDAGKLGDVITALIPYSDDTLIFGGDHTIWVLHGDPADGGVIDNISYQTGIVGPEAFAWDPEGNLYFFGTDALWRLNLGAGSLENLSAERMNRSFGEIDFALYHVRLLWDNHARGLHIYLTPNSEPTEAPEHFFWDQRTDGFWMDTMPVAHGPTAVHVFDADDVNDRAILLGGFDSYIRRIDENTNSDDGTVITSLIIFPPIIAAGDLANVRLSELTVVMDTDSDPAYLGIYADESVQATLDDLVNPRVSRVLHAGRNSSIRQRVNGNSIIIIMASASLTTVYSWALESMTGLIALTGKTRKGRL